MPKTKAAAAAAAAAATPASSSLAPLIKGYLPVRLKLPGSTGGCDGDGETTFFYVKEHHSTTTTAITAEGAGNNSISSSNNKNNKKKNGNNNTLFVSNCPTVPNVTTKLLLKSIFGRYGEVTRVTVIANPRRQHKDGEASSLLMGEQQQWTTKFAAPSYHSHHHQYYHGSDGDYYGKFAHVVFASTKEMKRTFKALQQAMMGITPTTTSAANDSSDDDPQLSTAAAASLQLDTIELQTLADETDRQRREKEGEESDDDDDNDIGKSNPTTTATGGGGGGILAVAARYRAATRRLCGSNGSNGNNRHERLLDECNAVMRDFEDAAQQANADALRSSSVPDADGFVTVSYASAASTSASGGGSSNQTRDASLLQMELKDRRGRTAAASGIGGSAKKRARREKKKGMGGAEPLPDFYRFQTREHRKKSLQDLRQRFEEDLHKVQKMKEERQYRPF